MSDECESVMGVTMMYEYRENISVGGKYRELYAGLCKRRAVKKIAVLRTC